MQVTTKIYELVQKKAKEHGSTEEGLGNMVLLLALSDERLVKQAAELLAHYHLGGATDMNNKGW